MVVMLAMVVVVGVPPGIATLAFVPDSLLSHADVQLLHEAATAIKQSRLFQAEYSRHGGAHRLTDRPTGGKMILPADQRRVRIVEGFRAHLLAAANLPFLPDSRLRATAPRCRPSCEGGCRVMPQDGARHGGRCCGARPVHGLVPSIPHWLLQHDVHDAAHLSFLTLRAQLEHALQRELSGGGRPLRRVRFRRASRSTAVVVPRGASAAVAALPTFWHLLFCGGTCLRPRARGRTAE